MFLKELSYHFSILIGYTTIWHMTYYCTPVNNKLNNLIIYFHGNLIKNNDKK